MKSVFAFVFGIAALSISAHAATKTCYLVESDMQLGGGFRVDGSVPFVTTDSGKTYHADINYNMGPFSATIEVQPKAIILTYTGPNNTSGGTSIQNTEIAPSIEWLDGTLMNSAIEWHAAVSCK